MELQFRNYRLQFRKIKSNERARPPSFPRFSRPALTTLGQQLNPFR